ncbi:hypothetical protein BJX62DRAFT_212275 [Aspergillus germanicus]
MEKRSSSSSPPIPPPLALAKFRKISSALLNRKPLLPRPGPVSKWNVRVPPGMSLNENPPGMPPANGFPPGPPPPPGVGAGPPRRRYSRPNWS